MMRSAVETLAVLTVMLLVFSSSARAQEATIAGTVTDSTGGVLPGVTVTALHEATGNTFVGVTDDTGNYRLAVRTGNYKVTAELAGFGSASKTLELLVGQQGIVNLQMSLSGLQENVTVTGEAPLIDVTQSKVGGNIDPRQIKDLPVNSRNWSSLALLAPGSTANEAGNAPADRTTTGGRPLMVNVDGQQISSLIGNYSIGETKFSSDAISEFEVIANRFDATQGRSAGMQINAVTKSGTNAFLGTFSGYFRDDKFNAADFVAHRVLPYSDQQVVTTFGGPIIKNKLHFFAHYEGEREPQSVAFTTPYPAFNLQFTVTRVEKKYGGRVDTQLTPTSHFSVRATGWSNLQPIGQNTFPNTASAHPSSLSSQTDQSHQIFGTFSETLGQKAVNELKGGYSDYSFSIGAYGHGGAQGRIDGSEIKSLYLKAGAAPGTLIPLDGFPPTINFRGFTVGPGANNPYVLVGHVSQIRDDFTYVLARAGHHEFKVGGEYLKWVVSDLIGSGIHGVINATNGPIPSNIQTLIPVWNDWTTWNLAALSPITANYQKAFGTFTLKDPRDTFASWFQDNWTVVPRLTLNLGLRWDMSVGANADRIGALPPFRLADNIATDRLNFAPRLGFAYSLANKKTVIRGGWGKYFSEPQNTPNNNMHNALETVVPTAFNDGRANFAADPYNGQILTYQSILASGIRRDIANNIYDPVTGHTPYSWQASLGFQHQLGEIISVEADYAWTGGRREDYLRNANLTYNPVTGANYPFTDLNHIPYPQFGLVPMRFRDGWSNQHMLSTAVTKRFSQRWQASATYTLAGLWDAVGVPKVGFDVAPDLGGEYTLAATDQRHRAVFNGIWDLVYGFQISGTYFFGSGKRFNTTYGGDLRQVGTQGTARLRPDGTIVPRNDFIGHPLHRADLRLQRHFRIAGSVGADGLLDIYNAFNHANFGNYVTAQSSANYGKPAQVQNVAYLPRTLQLGFRFSF